MGSSPTAAPPALADVIGSNVRHLRDQADLTQLGLANKAGITPRTVSYIETAARIPDLPTLMRLARAFDVSLDTLVSPGGAG